MAEDPYSLLGVAKDATTAQIRAAFRKLAKRHHPDVNPGDKAAEERFKAISAAHGLLEDPAQRARFDRGEIDASGAERAPPRPRRPAAGGRAGGPAGARFQADDLSDLFSDMLREHQASQGRRPGRDHAYSLEVTLREAMLGATRRLALPEGGTIEVKIPPGIAHGQTLRLRGRGGAGLNGGPVGDALIEIQVAPHPYFRRDGDDVLLDLPVTFAEAVLGARVRVPTLAGLVSMAIPPHADTGTVLRLRGRGVPAVGGRPAGDQRVSLVLVAGLVDAALEEFLRAHPAPPDHPAADPRRAMTDAAERESAEHKAGA